MGGFCPGGFCPRGGFCPGGFCPGDFVRGGFVQGDFVLEPQIQHHVLITLLYPASIPTGITNRNFIALAMSDKSVFMCRHKILSNLILGGCSGLGEQLQDNTLIFLFFIVITTDVETNEYLNYDLSINLCLP